MTNETTALVIGATGGVGGEVARVLLARGWTVRGLARDPGKAAATTGLQGIEWRSGDAMNAADIERAAAGAAVIFHGANPPGYRNWRGLALPMLDNTIAAAGAVGATILFPGTVYNFGPDAWPLVSERSPQRPTTRKGKIRVEMEQKLARAAEAGTRVLIVRAGDFFGPRVGNSWLAQGMVTPGQPVKKIVYPGRRDVGHDWAYLPDLAETMVRLVERRETLAPFDVFHFRGHYFERGVEIAEAIRRVAGKPGLKISGFPWPVAYLAAPFVETMREMIEMRYLWTERLELDNSKLLAELGEEPHTPLDDAMRETLVGLGCLQA